MFQVPNANDILLRDVQGQRYIPEPGKNIKEEGKGRIRGQWKSKQLASV